MKPPKLLVAIAFLFALSSCKKYEEGPSLSLRSKKARVSNEWKIDYAFDFDDGKNVTSDYFGETWEFKMDGGFSEREDGVVKKSGTWQFVNEKEAILINIIGSGKNPETFTILKLKERELWLKEEDEEIHLIPAN